ncbi:nucleoporin Nup43 [Parasteatoda tepidariorum]|uniref:nucleoporin Nup43 n=1 Tax=Parasteatoda tepidariorum TaxID=114398 RepID=UPI0039BCCCF2
MSSIKVKFVSRKINKVRWVPKSTTKFITGSYNDDDNNLSVWKFPSSQTENGDIDNCFEDFEPVTVCTKPFSGDVTDLKVFSEDFIFASSSRGSICAFKLSDDQLETLHTWENAHSFCGGTASTTGISVKGDNLASVGEDGRLCIFNINTKQNIKEIESSDLCSFTCICHLRHQEIVAGNSLGYLRLWDLRNPSNTPSCLLIVSREQKTVTCLNTHPTQPHILATGYEDGSLCMWDMRHEKKPMSLMEAHTAAVSELLFHPINPDFLYTSSIDGTLWQWDSTKMKNNLTAVKTGKNPNVDLEMNQDSTKGNPWLNCEANKHKLEITGLFSQSWSCVNSLDINDSILLWGTDNEALCIINDIIV